MSKAAAIAVARWLAATYGSPQTGNLKVSCACPQAVHTDMTAGVDPRKHLHAAAAIAGKDGVLTAQRAAELIFDGIRAGRFLIFPHPVVHSYARRAIEDPERWLEGMQRLVKKLDAAGARPANGKNVRARL